MNLEQSIKTNIQVAKLIKGKHDNDGFPGVFPKRDAIEAKYYLAILADIDKARSALGNDGLAELIDDFVDPPKVQIVAGKLGGGKRKPAKAKKETPETPETPEAKETLTIQ